MDVELGDFFNGNGENKKTRRWSYVYTTPRTLKETWVLLAIVFKILIKKLIEKSIFYENHKRK